MSVHHSYVPPLLISYSTCNTYSRVGAPHLFDLPLVEVSVPLDGHVDVLRVEPHENLDHLRRVVLDLAALAVDETITPHDRRRHAHAMRGRRHEPSVMGMDWKRLKDLLVSSLIFPPVEDGPAARLVTVRILRIDSPDEGEERPRRGIPTVHDTLVLFGSFWCGALSGRGLGGFLGLSANVCEQILDLCTNK